MIGLLNWPKTLFAATLCTMLLIGPWSKAAAIEMDSRVQILLVSMAYGSAGGGLLGIASMAFGAGARTVAQGASLGLYVGVLFGSYVIFSHHYQIHESQSERGYGKNPWSSPMLPGIYSEGMDIDQLRFWQNSSPTHKNMKFHMDLWQLTF